MPDSDRDSRESEFAKYVQNISWEKAKVSARLTNSDLLFLVFFVGIDSAKTHPITSDMFLCGRSVDEIVDDWPKGDRFLIQPVKFSAGNNEIVMASASAPGKLKDELVRWWCCN